jgi:hypothetical protein
MRDLPRIVADTPVGKDVEVVVFAKEKETKSVVRVPGGRESRRRSLTRRMERPKKSRREESARARSLNLTDDLRKKHNIKDKVKAAS